MDISVAINDIIDNKEGGYVNDNCDRGGETKYGITQSVARYNGYHGEMCNLSREYAEMIYNKIYWSSPGFCYVALTSEDVALKLFDMGVICGVSFACCSFQRVLNVFNDKGLLYQDLKIDGDIGPLTRGAFRAYVGYRGQIGVINFIKVLNGIQVSRFLDLAELNETQEKFFYGWIDKRIG